MSGRNGFYIPADEPPVRPAEIERLTFEGHWEHRDHRLAEHLVPLDCVEPGDEQVAVFYRERWPRPKPVTSLDVLAGHPSVESVVGAGNVRATVPLPHIRELFANEVDEATLRNLPNLESAAIGSGPDGRALDASALRAGIGKLSCGEDTFGSLQALVARFAELERLRLGSLDESADPLGRLENLRWLSAGPRKGLHHLAKLERLERLELYLEDTRLAGLQRFRGRWPHLRHLDIAYGGLNSIDGIETFQELEYLRLLRPGIEDLSPLAELPRLVELRIEAPRKRVDFSPIGRLESLRRLELDVGTATRDVEMPTLSWLAGCRALEEVEITNVDLADRDLSVLMELPNLRRIVVLGVVGDWKQRLQERFPEADIALRRIVPEPPKTKVGSISYSRVDDSTWSIFTFLADELGVENDFESEKLVRAAIASADRALAGRLDFDSEPEAVSILATSEPDIRRAAEIVDTLKRSR